MGKLSGIIIPNGGKKNWWKRSLPASDTFYLRHSEHEAHLWQGETGKWSSAMVLFLIASKLIRQHKMLDQPHTQNWTMRIVFLNKRKEQMS